MKTKKCSKCKIEKPLTEFHANKKNKDGHWGHCKSCRAKYDAEYHAKNREKRLKQSAEYYVKNKEKISKRTAEHRSLPEVKEMMSKQRAEYLSRPEVKEMVSKQKAEYRERINSEQPNCVYQIKNLENNKVYIGESTRGELRWKKHLRDLRGDYHPNKLLQEEFNKYGEEVFEWSILKEFESEDRDALLLEEARTIQRYLEDGVELYNVRLTSKQLKMLEEDKKSQ